VIYELRWFIWKRW